MQFLESNQVTRHSLFCYKESALLVKFTIIIIIIIIIIVIMMMIIIIIIIITRRQIRVTNIRSHNCHHTRLQRCQLRLFLSFYPLWKKLTYIQIHEFLSLFLIKLWNLVNKQSFTEHGDNHNNIVYVQQYARFNSPGIADPKIQLYDL